jgi:lysozyme
MYRILLCTLFLSFEVYPPINLAVAGDDSVEYQYSRQELYFVMRELDQGTVQFALPPKFSFPDNARNTSTFGIDISNNNERACNCHLNWANILSNNVRFVYLKATEGATYTDSTYLRSYPVLRDFQSRGIANVGVYHFLTSTSEIDEQIHHFLNVYNSPSPQDLPPSLDLEWNLGAWNTDCPSNATVKIRGNGGLIVQRCDLWYGLTGDDIISKANAWIDAVKNTVKREPLVYTNAAWWNARIGNALKLNQLHTSLIWIADYSKGGLGTEEPRVPANHPWDLWQFSETATVSNGNNDLTVDASIYEKDADSFKRQLGVSH